MRLRVVPARTGLRWVARGLAWTARQPGPAFLTIGLYVIGMLLLSAVPVVGGILPLAAAQIASVGFMLAGRRISRGERVSPSVLFAGLTCARPQVRDLITLAGIYVGAVLGLLLLSSLADGGTLLRMMVFARLPAGDPLADPAVQRAALIGAMGYIPLSMAFWFAPLLVSCWSMSPGQALFTSLLVVGRNAGAFVLYQLQWAMLFAGVPLLASGLALLTGVGPHIAALAGMVVATPLFVAFTVSGYATVESLLGEGES